jgi:2-polyprenyl-6-hydroxyphenyl methylase/3-demethylubiquinone-9 3-methyltransferase
MATLDRGELTKPAYWDDQWRRLEVGNHYAALGWMQRSYHYSALDRLLRSVLPVDPTKSFVEIGSGPGRFLIYFNRVFGYQVSGCDYSPASCTLARENLARAGVAGTIHQADLFEFQGQYDVVYSGGVIEHFESPGPVVETLARLVKPGGYLVTTVPNLKGLNGLYRRVLKPDTFETHRTITLEELRSWHRCLGLREVLATAFGSLCLNRVPSEPFPGLPRLQRLVWAPAYRATWAASNRLCFLLHRVGLRVEGQSISPHLLVIAQRPAEPRP